MSLLLSTALLAAPVSVPPPSEAVAIRFAPEEGTVLRRTYESVANYDLDEIDLRMDGEPPPFELPEPSMSVEATESLVVVDTLGAVEDGRPETVERSFASLGWTTAFSGDDLEEAEEVEVCGLEGETVVFTWNADEEEYDVALDEDSEADTDLLEYLQEDMDLRAFLPADEVEEGDSWDLEADAYLSLIWPGGLLQSHIEGEESDPVQLEMSLALIEDVDCEGSASLEEVREEDGVRVAELRFELEIESDGSVDVDAEEGSVTLLRELERTLEGTILWDLDAGHALALSGSAENEMTSTSTQSMEDPEGGEHELEQSQTFSGSVTYSITFERE